MIVQERGGRRGRAGLLMAIAHGRPPTRKIGWNLVRFHEAASESHSTIASSCFQWLQRRLSSILLLTVKRRSSSILILLLTVATEALFSCTLSSPTQRILTPVTS